jgi:hypothetical protein
VFSPIEGPDGAKVAESMKYWRKIPISKPGFGPQNIEMKVGCSNHFTISTLIISPRQLIYNKSALNRKFLEINWMKSQCNYQGFLPIIFLKNNLNCKEKPSKIPNFSSKKIWNKIRLGIRRSLISRKCFFFYFCSFDLRHSQCWFLIKRKWQFNSLFFCEPRIQHKSPLF